MGRLGINYEQVVEAADEILAAGSVPTIEKIRLKLGSTGSNSTINRHLNDWKKSRLQPSAQTPNPTALPDTLQRSLTETWEKIRSESQTENERLRREAQELIAAAEQQKKIAESRAQTLEEALEKIKIANNHLQADLKINQEALEKECKQVTVLQERVHQYDIKFQERYEETEKRVHEVARFSQDKINLLQQRLEAQEKKCKEELNDMKELAEKQRHQHITVINQLRTEKEKVEKSQLKTEMVLHHTLQKTKELETIKNQLNEDLFIKNQQLDEQAQQASELQQETVALKAELKQKEHLTIDLKQTGHALQEKVHNLLEQIAQLKAENKMLTKELSLKESSS